MRRSATDCPPGHLVSDRSWSGGSSGGPIQQALQPVYCPLTGRVTEAQTSTRPTLVTMNEDEVMR